MDDQNQKTALPWWAYALIIVAVLIVLYIILKKTGVIGGIGDIGKLAKGLGLIG